MVLFLVETGQDDQYVVTIGACMLYKDINEVFVLFDIFSHRK